MSWRILCGKRVYNTDTIIAISGVSNISRVVASYDCYQSQSAVFVTVQLSIKFDCSLHPSAIAQNWGSKRYNREQLFPIIITMSTTKSIRNYTQPPPHPSARNLRADPAHLLGHPTCVHPPPLLHPATSFLLFYEYFNELFHATLPIPYSLYVVKTSR